MRIQKHDRGNDQRQRKQVSHDAKHEFSSRIHDHLLNEDENTQLLSKKFNFFQRNISIYASIIIVVLILPNCRDIL